MSDVIIFSAERSEIPLSPEAFFFFFYLWGSANISIFTNADLTSGAMDAADF